MRPSRATASLPPPRVAAEPDRPSGQIAMELILIIVAVFLSFSNGANDNFKGFATVWGSDTLSYRQALMLASIATALGSLASLALAHALVMQFTGKGIVPDHVAGDAGFVLGVGVGAATTVMLATRLGLPVSTTHALVGGLVGAGFAQDGAVVHLGTLAAAFLLPLLVSPFIAATLAALASRLARRRASERDCACVVAEANQSSWESGAAAARLSMTPRLVVAQDAECDRLTGTVARVRLSKSKDAVHIASAASICFARGVNDTPKLAALLMTAQAIGPRAASVVIAAAMVLGGWLFARRVARTMSRRIATLDHAQGLSANLVTAGLVLLASKFGLPVSTTHVSVGAIAGVGIGGGSIQWQTTRNILLSWIGTLPLAALTAYLAVRLGGI
jgi:PiT family inorganic phosphate transporter